MDRKLRTWGAFALLSLSLEGTHAQAWTHKATTDDFTDETVRIASVDYETGGHTYSLFVNCRDGGSLSVGLSGTYINPTGGEYDDEQKRFEVPVRFDSDDPSDEELTVQGNVMFLTSRAARVVARLLDDPAKDLAQINRRMLQIFVKNLADRSRLRIKFPQHRSPVVLDFSLAGARDALLEVARGLRHSGRGRDEGICRRRRQSIPYFRGPAHGRNVVWTNGNRGHN